MSDVACDNIDLISEKFLISSLITHGFKAYSEICDIVTDDTFIADTHSCFYRAAEAVFKIHGDIARLDYPTLLSGANSIGLNGFFEKKEEKAYLKTLKEYQSEFSSIKMLGAKLRKLEIARTIRDQLSSIDKQLSLITGEEKSTDILGLVEGPVLDFGQLIRGADKTGPKLIFKDIKAYVQHLIDNPRQQVGIASGFPKYDMAIGGGFRPGTVSVIASRLKIGKSSLCDNVAHNVNKQGIPVLVLDSEMSEDEHFPRMVASVSGVPIYDIERGILTPTQLSQVNKATDILEKLPYHYHNICGEPFEQTISEMRRWIMKEVGLDSNGHAKPCLIILDYLKVQSGEGITKNIAEYQLLGLLTTSFVNFANKYKVPCLTFAQVNRDGIDINNTDTGVIAGSDRIGWFASNLTLFRAKSEEEIGEQVAKGQRPIYNRCLHFLCSRHGPGLDSGDWLNIDFNTRCCKINEGLTRFELERNSKAEKMDDGRIVTDDDPTIEY